MNEDIEELIEVAFARVQKKDLLAAHYGHVLDILRDGVCDKCELARTHVCRESDS